MEPQRSSWPAVLTALVAILALASVPYVMVGHRPDRTLDPTVQPAQDDAVLGDPRWGAITPYQLARDAIQRFGPAFNRAYGRTESPYLRSAFSASHLTINEEALVHDLETAIRAVVGYIGTVPIGGHTVELHGEVRRYYHDEGAVSIEAFCLAGIEDCGGPFRRLVAQAELGVREALTTTTLTGILPASDDCDFKTDSLIEPSRPVTVYACVYGAGTVVAVSRLDRATAVGLLAAVTADPVLQILR
jgi:hypothetical protein